VRPKRIKLRKGKQRELIDRAKNKNKLTWKELAKTLGISSNYLRNELYKEKHTLSQPIYEKLCKMANVNFNPFIEKILDFNWGQKRGAENSPVTKKRVIIPKLKPSTQVAEIIGTILGDGSLSEKNGAYVVSICGHSKDDKEYLLNFVKKLFEKVFNIELKHRYHRSRNEIILYVYNKRVVEELKNLGLPCGNKKKNNVEIPKWVFKNSSFLKACIRGLIDTDGSVFPKTTNAHLPQIEFSSKIPKLRNSFIKGLKKLGFNPSRPHSKDNRNVGLYSRRDVYKYIKEIGFNNLKHKLKIERILSAPVV